MYWRRVIDAIACSSGHGVSADPPEASSSLPHLSPVSSRWLPISSPSTGCPIFAVPSPHSSTPQDLINSLQLHFNSFSHSPTDSLPRSNRQRTCRAKVHLVPTSGGPRPNARCRLTQRDRESPGAAICSPHFFTHGPWRTT